jgi:anti-sigma regulatory factor (Ser/Thr protein kinase)
MPGGVGLICLRQWMDEVTYAPQPDGGILTTLIRQKRI